MHKRWLRTSLVTAVVGVWSLPALAQVPPSTGAAAPGDTTELAGPGPGALPPPGVAVPPASPTAPTAPADNAQRFDASAKRIDKTLDDLLEVPETPAAFALGLSADVVARPSSLKEVAGALKTVVGSNGKLLPGAALELAPFYRLVTRDVTAEKWATEWYRPLLSGFRLSLATAADPRATDPDNAPTLVALGARLGIDTTDIRFHREAVEALRQELIKCAPAPTLPSGKEGEVTHLELTPACEFEKKEEALTSNLSGIRAELASTLTFADRQVTDTDAELRAVRAWGAFEGRTSATFGAGIAGDYELIRQPGPNIHNLRGGARVNLDTTAVDGSFGIAYVRRTQADKGENWFDVGGSVSAKVSSLGSLSIGVQMARSLDDNRRDLIALLAITSASGESLVSKYFGPKTQTH